MDYKMTPVQMEAAEPEKPILVYAGFWKRFVAALIDGVLLWIVNMILSMAFFGGAMLSLGSLRRNDPAAAASVMAGFGMYYFMTICIGWLYSAFMESSANQATLGKMALGLRVTDLEGNRISFARASGRYFSKFASAIILMIGYIMAGFTQKKQALHDMIAGTLVVGKSSTVPQNVAANVYRSEAVSA